MRCFLIGFAGFIVATIVALLVFPLYGDYTARAEMAQTISIAGPLRERISDILTGKGAGA